MTPEGPGGFVPPDLSTLPPVDVDALRAGWSTPADAWQAIAVPVPVLPVPAPDAAFFSSEDARRDFYANGTFGGDRFSPSRVMMAEPEFRDALVRKAELAAGMRVLLIGEFFVPDGVVAWLQEIVGETGEIVYVEMIPTIERHDIGRFPIYTEVCAGYADGEFDAIVASQWHHCLDPDAELVSLSRAVRPGGKVVLFEPGPTRETFELAEHDVWLDALLRFMVTRGGVREVNLEHAYAWKRAAWTAVGIDDIASAATRCLDEVRAWQHRGLMLVDGRRTGGER